jgi:hypothetical protein
MSATSKAAMAAADQAGVALSSLSRSNGLVVLPIVGGSRRGPGKASVSERSEAARRDNVRAVRSGMMLPVAQQDDCANINNCVEKVVEYSMTDRFV